jgi:two-component system cell cycle sensor histidine kinase/response regulator CckA
MSTLLLADGVRRDEDVEPWRAAPGAEPDSALAPTGRSILVAEDDPLVLGVIERLLAEQGHDVLTARNGAEALRLALAGRVDLLVTDVRMPVMDGWELSAQMRDRWPRLPVLFVSGYDVELTQYAAGRGVPGAFLRKPFEPDELVRQVTRLLGA